MWLRKHCRERADSHQGLYDRMSKYSSRSIVRPSNGPDRPHRGRPPAPRARALYYLTSGQADPILITIPKGGYVPVFSPWSPPSLAAPAAPVVSPTTPNLRFGGSHRDCCCRHLLALLAAERLYWRGGGPPARSGAPETKNTPCACGVVRGFDRPEQCRGGNRERIAAGRFSQLSSSGHRGCGVRQQKGRYRRSRHHDLSLQVASTCRAIPSGFGSGCSTGPIDPSCGLIVIMAD